MRRILSMRARFPNDRPHNAALCRCSRIAWTVSHDRIVRMYKGRRQIRSLFACRFSEGSPILIELPARQGAGPRLRFTSILNESSPGGYFAAKTWQPPSNVYHSPGNLLRPNRVYGMKSAMRPRGRSGTRGRDDITVTRAEIIRRTLSSNSSPSAPRPLSSESAGAKLDLAKQLAAEASSKSR